MGKYEQSTPNAGGVQSLSRAAAILRALSVDDQNSSLGQLAERVGLPRSTVQRIVNTLIVEGMVVSGKDAGGYRLGPEIRLLANTMKHDIARELHPMLVRLAEETEETVDLALLRNDCMVFIDQAVGTQRLRTVSAIGETFPILVTANGKAAMSLLDDESIERTIEQAHSQSTLVKPKKLLKNEIKTAKESGYALDIDEHTVGISAAGIAFEKDGFIYAISIPAPSSRFQEKKRFLIESLLTFADSVDSLLR
ncbi:MAG: IclR family transcriptional regulator [Gammaproteobacteria bacterium]|nr:IclR family transcriptional regulator [Gammaproteobacteria bacterium]